MAQEETKATEPMSPTQRSKTQFSQTYSQYKQEHLEKGEKVSLGNFARTTVNENFNNNLFQFY